MVRAFKVLAIIGMVLAVAGPAWAQDSTEDEQTKINSITFPDDAKGANWTDQQFKDATPLPMPVIEGKKAPSKSRSSPSLRSMRSGKQPAQSESRSDLPLKWAGKMFFRKEGEDYVCSGQFISERVVLTAAHCVQNRDTGRYVSDLVFALQYRNGKYRSQHRAKCIATFNGWTMGLGVPKEYEWDYAMFLVDKPSPSGNFGYHYSWRGDYQNDTLVGYPTKIAGGRRIIVVKGRIDNNPYGGDIAITSSTHGESNFQGGSSGGAWIAKYTTKSGSGNYVIGVNSHYYRESITTMYSPYFRGEFQDLLRYTENGCR